MDKYYVTRQLRCFLKRGVVFSFVLSLFFIYGAQYSLASDESASVGHSLWSMIIGRPADSRVYLGMWALHLNEQAIHDDNAVNDLVAVTYNGYSAGAFKNSYYDWTYAASFQREVYEKNWSHNLSLHIGYRAGGIVGYDDRLCGDLCSKSPLLPFVVPYFNLQKSNIGFESQFAFTVLTAGLYYHL